ncbi:SprT family protein [Salsuginibacillus kocurii]|uniref:SprT family protein n=1 Tax=Salsuginibacillus kocurii TaxID=427078 RepID=UPI0003A866CD|nr:SprT family protein [Salsuginibacillus kocurii]
MNNEELQRLTEDISTEYFGRIFHHEAYFNARLRTTGGRYMLNTHAIEINPKHYQEFGKEEICDILKHELCHYHLHLEGRGYRHRDKEFKEWLAAVGGKRHCQSLSTSQSRSTKRHTYECMKCQLKYVRKRQMNTAKFVCGACSGALKKIN